jgi:hypothetical protein
LRFPAAAKRAITVARKSAFWQASGLVTGPMAMPWARPGTDAIVGQLLLASFEHPMLPLAFLCP